MTVEMRVMKWEIISLQSLCQLHERCLNLHWDLTTLALFGMMEAYPVGEAMRMANSESVVWMILEMVEVRWVPIWHSFLYLEEILH